MTGDQPARPSVRVVSFGYLHRAAPAADMTVDLRQHFRDPHAVDGLRHLTAADPRVMAAVLATPGIPGLITALSEATRACLAGGGQLVTVAVGCAGGRHRSAAVATSVAGHLAAAGIDASAEHLDIAKPVVARQAEGMLLCLRRRNAASPSSKVAPAT